MSEEPPDNHRSLRVWQDAVGLADEVYDATEGFPSFELYGLRSQMCRAAVSVPSNIAEGKARYGTREYLHHLSIACGSIAELDTQIEIAGRRGYIDADGVEHLRSHVTSVWRQLNALRRALQDRS